MIRKLIIAINEAISNAHDNGCAAEIDKMTDEEFAVDLLDRDSDVAAYSMAEVMQALAFIRGGVDLPLSDFSQYKDR